MAGLQSLLGEALRLHQAGLMEQAAPLYRQVLAGDPRNSDALHLLGMIALQQGQAGAAVDLIGKALALRDDNASYHFHLACAFQSLNDLDRAVAGYRRALALKPDDPDIHNNMGNALAAQGRLEEAIQAFQRALGCRPDNALIHNNLGNVQRSLGLDGEAEASFRKALALQPGFPGALVNLGNLQQSRGELHAAEDSYRRALALAPRLVAAHCGRGLTLQRLGRRDQAAECYRAALNLDPDHPETLQNLGNMRWEDGALAEAEALQVRALAARPTDPDILDSLARLKLARGDGGGAMELVCRSLAVRETVRARKLFVRLAQHWDSPDDGSALRPMLVRALEEAWDRPVLLAGAAARMIRANPAIAAMMRRAADAWPRPLSLAALLDGSDLAVLAEDALFAALLTAAPNTDIPLERFLIQLRGAMLRTLEQRPAATPQAERVAAVLAQQCFINEYVFSAETGELDAAAILLKEAQPTALQLLLCAAYFPLHRRDKAEELLTRPWPAAVQEVLTQQLREVTSENRLRREIPRLTAIENPVSQQVQGQYEESPYPRWVRAAAEAPDTLTNFLTAKFPGVPFEPPSAPLTDILVAGCGTGQRAIALARKFPAGRILAVDLSLASLSYARRKSEELGLAIAYGQGDILELEKLECRFDMIESLGVLHHLADPFAGWRGLLSLLRPGGVMLLGLYSARAREPIARARARIAALGLGADIRRARQLLLESEPPEPSILESEDFFTLSACRDLLFHVQEHHTGLKEIARFVADQELRLLGFELDDAVLGAYRRRFPQDRTATDLDCWDAFEAEHPGLFAGMYVFWIQKPGGEGQALCSTPALLQSEIQSGPGP